MMRLATLLAVMAAPAWADAPPPVSGPQVASLEYGVFCALQAMDKRPAPGTEAGWVHVPDGPIDFHWPDRQVVPAALGLAFGVKARMRPGVYVGSGEVRVWRPGNDQPEIWDSSFTDMEGALNFFRFDHDRELLPGIWIFEAWDGNSRLFSVAFEVVPTAALPEIAQACGVTS